jgi:hypothetical protein
MHAWSLFCSDKWESVGDSSRNAGRHEFRIKGRHSFSAATLFLGTVNSPVHDPHNFVELEKRPLLVAVRRKSLGGMANNFYLSKDA